MNEDGEVVAINPAEYPPDWQLRSRFVRFYRAKNRCEWCGAENRKPHPVTGSKVVLTTAHVHDKTKSNGRLLNLAALCQRCHLRHDAPDRLAARRLKNRAPMQGEMFAASCREFLRGRINELGFKQQTLARLMGMTPVALCRRLSQSPSDSMVFSLDNLESYIDCTGDTKPVLYLVEKYMTDSKTELERLKARIAELEGKG